MVSGRCSDRSSNSRTPGITFSFAARQLLSEQLQIEVEKCRHVFLGEWLSIFRQNLMRDAGVSSAGDLHALQIAAGEPLGRRQLNGPGPRRTRADEGAVNIPEEETIFFH